MFKFALLILTAAGSSHTYFHDEPSCAAAVEWIAAQGSGHIATCLPLEAGRLDSGIMPTPARKPVGRS